MELIAIAGLLHDIGFVNLSKEKMKFFTFQDDLEVSDRGRHAIDGYNIIKNQNIDTRIKQAVLTHHEGLDGSGFPLQVSHFDINQISRIIAIADTYDILTMKEEGRESLSVFSALRKMETCYYNKLDAHFLLRFTANIADAMIQHQVLLSNGQVGKVVMINKYDISKSLIQVEDAFIDLSREKNIYIKEDLD